MSRRHFQGLLLEAGITADLEAPVDHDSLEQRVTLTLGELGLRDEDLHTLDASIQSTPKTAPTAVALGAGFTAWSLTRGNLLSSKAMSRAFDAAGTFADFLHKNWSDISNGWDVEDKVCETLAEFFLRLPTGSLDVVQKLFETIESAADLADLLDAGEDIANYVTSFEIAADAADLADALSSFGVGLGASWLAKKAGTAYVDWRFEKALAKHEDRIARLNREQNEIAKLRLALQSGLASPAVAMHLPNVAGRHWDF